MPRRILHEVEEKDVVKVGAHLRLVIEVELIVKLREFENDLNGLGLVGSGETAVLLPLEDAIAALEDKVRADGVAHAVLALVPALLLGDEDNSAEVFGLAGRHQ